MHFFTLKKKEPNGFLVQRNSYLMQVCQYMFRDQRDALWNWSNSQELRYDEPNLATNKYNPLGTRFVIRWWKKKQRITNCRTMTMRYGIILEDGIETFLDSGCRATSFIQTMKTEFSHNINWKIPIAASIIIPSWYGSWIWYNITMYY